MRRETNGHVPLQSGKTIGGSADATPSSKPNHSTPNDNPHAAFQSGTATTPSGTAPQLSTTSDGVSPSDANLNLANATVLVADRKGLVARANSSCLSQPTLSSGGFVLGTTMSAAGISASCQASRQLAKKQLVELDAKLAKLGYKVDATGTLVRI